MSTTTGVSIRRGAFRDPKTDIVYQSLTNLSLSVEPGIIALLYKLRWDIEKVFALHINRAVERLTQRTV